MIQLELNFFPDETFKLMDYVQFVKEGNSVSMPIGSKGTVIAHKDEDDVDVFVEFDEGTNTFWCHYSQLRILSHFFPTQ